MEVRREAREVALYWIREQATSFRRWGTLGPWSRLVGAAAGGDVDISNVSATNANVDVDAVSGYTTMSPAYEARQLRLLAALVERGLVERSVRPVYWSPASRSALAESELEYRDDHVSTAVAVLFRTSDPADRDADLWLPAWTTTPWTLPANEALCVDPEAAYAVFELPDGSGRRAAVMASELASVAQRIAAEHGDPGSASPAAPPQQQPEIEIIRTIRGADLVGLRAHHPLHPAKTVPVHEAWFVASGTGTGIVHCAPGHGIDDHILGQRLSLPSPSPVDEQGRFAFASAPALALESSKKTASPVPVRDDGGDGTLAAALAPALDGLPVATAGNDAVLALLRESGSVLYAHAYSHRYPYDWRTKTPVILRATPQWFVSLNDDKAGSGVDAAVKAAAAGPSVKASAARALEDVDLIPASGRARLSSFVNARDEWCVSRQRPWGVPIPALYRRGSHLSEAEVAILDPGFIRHLADLVEAHPTGTDVWWERPLAELMTPDIESRLGCLEAGDLVRGEDTLDVWLDSGASWFAVTNSSLSGGAATADGTADGRVASAAGATDSSRRDPALAAEASAAHSAAVPMPLAVTADLVIEGSDQHRGWFQSSLLTCAALTGRAPYKRVVTHGFVLDAQGRKMSKSLGNVVNPDVLIAGSAGEKSAGATTTTIPAALDGKVASDNNTDGSKKKGKKNGEKKKGSGSGGKAGNAQQRALGGPYGADVLRTWVASADFTKDLAIGRAQLDAASETLRRFRNACRFMVGNLHDHDAGAFAAAFDGASLDDPAVRLDSIDGLPHIDRYALHLLRAYADETAEAYGSLSYARVIAATSNFLSALSGIYFETAKDRLYAAPQRSRDRVACQAVLARACAVVVATMEPIACFTVHDVRMHTPAGLLGPGIGQGYVWEEGEIDGCRLIFFFFFFVNKLTPPQKKIMKKKIALRWPAAAT
jgi:isoleucyl-tRNA synthetase